MHFPVKKQEKMVHGTGCTVHEKGRLPLGVASSLRREKSRRDGMCITAGEAEGVTRGAGATSTHKSRRDSALLTVCFSLRTFSLRAILLSALFSCVSLHAQVTMGGLEEPKSGAILDLNSTTKGGLLLSNVELPNLYTIPYQGTNPFPGVDDTNYYLDGVKDNFAGAIVYHTGGNGIPAGIYVWNGTNWTSVEENCAPPALILTAPFLVEQGIPVAFSVASDASALVRDTQPP